MDMQTTIAVVLAWAVQLSGYDGPETPPAVEFKPHSFFVKHACGGRDCDAMGWYNDRGVVYVDERLRNQDTVFTRSLLVHEFVHYLQDLSGKFDTDACADQIQREREAYAYQRMYVAEVHGQVAFLRIQQRGC